MEKLKIIDIKGINDLSEILNTCYEVFKNTILNKDTRPMFGERTIFVPIK